MCDQECCNRLAFFLQRFGIHTNCKKQFYFVVSVLRCICHRQLCEDQMHVQFKKSFQWDFYPSAHTIYWTLQQDFPKYWMQDSWYRNYLLHLEVYPPWLSWKGLFLSFSYQQWKKSLRKWNKPTILMQIS